MQLAGVEKLITTFHWRTLKLVAAGRVLMVVGDGLRSLFLPLGNHVV